MYSRNGIGKFSLWIDWETSGADFDDGYDVTFSKYQGVSVGLVIADNETFEEVDSLYVEFKFDKDKYKWTEGAEKVHGLTIEHLEEHGVSREEGAAEIINFIIEYFGMEVLSQGPLPSKRVCIGGHNVAFDLFALEHLLAEFGFRLGVHHVRLETSSAGFIAMNQYKSNDLFSFFGSTERSAHNALEDARLSLSVARGIRSIVMSVLGD
jgi:hypothetical protein